VSRLTAFSVKIGRVAAIDEFNDQGTPKASPALEVNPKHFKAIPAHVEVRTNANLIPHV
jgi:hypothetical protein